MKLLKTDFKDLIVIRHNLFLDKRGFFKEIFKKEKLEKETSTKIDFCQENSVKSHLNVLRDYIFKRNPMLNQN